MRSLRVSLFVLCSVFLLLLLPPAIASAVTLQPAFDQSLVATVTLNRAYGVGMADFNGDGREDVVSANTAGDVYFFRSNGDGTFVRPATYAINAPYYDALTLVTGDFNGDGKQDVVTGSTQGASVNATDGVVWLWTGRGNGSFDTSGPLGSQYGQRVGDAGTDVQSVAAADVDGDGDLDVVASDVVNSENARADILLFRNLGNDGLGRPQWSTAETVSAMASQTVNPEQPPYYPPKNYLSAYGLAFGDVDGDDDQDLLVTDIATYLYVFRNDGDGHFSPVRYDTPGFETRPYAFTQLHKNTTFTTKMPVAVRDLNGDGRPDVVVGGSDSTWNGKVDLWLNNGLDGSGRPTFAGAGSVGGAGTLAQGLAIGQANPAADGYADVVFGNFEGNVYALLTDLTDTDGDGIINRVDNLPLVPNFPRIDLNGDGQINRLDQMDLDGDGIGSVMDAVTHELLGDEDADGDGVPNASDNLPFVPNADQLDRDGDGIGETSGPYPQWVLGDPLDNRDPDGDGVANGPFDAALTGRYKEAKRKLMLGDTPFVIRIDALGRWWQAEFTQTLSDSVFMDEATFAAKYAGNWDGTYGAGPTPPAITGGKSLPVSVMVIPKMLWTDPEVVKYLTDRGQDGRFEIGQHGTYHVAIQPPGMPDSELTGYDPLEMFVYMKVGQQTMLGDYDATPDYISATASDVNKIGWMGSANPLISFAPPYDEYDVNGVKAVAQLGYTNFSSDIYAAAATDRTKMPQMSDEFDGFGMLHTDATFMPYAEVPSWSHAPDYESYIRENLRPGEPNILLIEEVNFSGRGADGAVNNTIDTARWAAFQQLLDIVRTYPNATFLTLGEYSMARAYDNAPGIANADQADADHDGVGDVAQTAMTAEDAAAVAGETTLTAQLRKASGAPLAGRTVTFTIDADGDGTYDPANEPAGTAVTDAEGWARLPVSLALEPGDYTFQARFDGADGFVAAVDTASLAVRLATSLSADPFSGQAGDAATLRARLTSGSGDPVAGRTLTFAVDENGDGTYGAGEASFTAVTDADGYASVTQVLATTVEDTTYRASFAGDATFAAATPATGDLTLIFATTVTSQDATVVAGQASALRARLTKLGAPLAGKTISFTADGSSAGTAVTDADGYATFTGALSLPAKVTTFGASFAGDADSGPSNVAVAALVVRHPTALAARDNANQAVPPGLKFPKGVFLATLTDAYTLQAMAGRTVTFYVYGKTGLQLVGSDVTDAAGIAWVDMPRGANRLSQYRAVYGETQLYLGSQDDAFINRK